MPAILKTFSLKEQPYLKRNYIQRKFLLNKESSFILNVNTILAGLK